MNTRQIEFFISETLDRSTGDLSQHEYRDLLSNLISQLEVRLECVEEELAAEGEDE